jgi:hypothetical protein
VQGEKRNIGEIWRGLKTATASRSATQPRSLSGLQDERLQWAEEELREIVWDEATQKQVSRAPSTPAKGYTRTAPAWRKATFIIGIQSC